MSDLQEAKKLESRPYTFGDLKTFPENERWELIAGVPYLQAQPTFEHQEIKTELATQIRTYLRGKTCRVVTEPAVWLEEMSDAAKDYVIPDIAVICDNHKIVKDGIVGAPDMIIEIISPSTVKSDMLNKFYLYQKAGVKEYWIVEPSGKIVTVFVLGESGKYNHQGVYSEDNEIQVKIFDNLKINLRHVFT